jgi:hypothetical protein
VSVYIFNEKINRSHESYLKHVEAFIPAGCRECLWKLCCLVQIAHFHLVYLTEDSQYAELVHICENNLFCHTFKGFTDRKPLDISDAL